MYTVSTYTCFSPFDNQGPGAGGRAVFTPLVTGTPASPSTPIHSFYFIAEVGKTNKQMPRDTGSSRRRRRSSSSSSDDSAARRRQKRRREKKSGWGLTTAPENASGIPSAQGGISATRIYVGSVSFDATEQDVTTAFQRFGAIRSCTLADDTVRGHHKGYCFLEFATKEGADAALRAPADSILLKGRACKIGMPSSIPTTESGAPQGAASALLASGTIGHEEEIKISGATARAEVMRRLAASKGMVTPAAHTITLPGMPAPVAAPQKKRRDANLGVNPLLVDNTKKTIPSSTVETLERPVGFATTPSTVMCVLNMVNDVDDADDELAAEVKLECSKHGTVANLLVYDEKQPNGEVVVKLFVQFATSIEASSCIKVMHNRLFDGKRLVAFPFSESLFKKIEESPD